MQRTSRIPTISENRTKYPFAWTDSCPGWFHRLKTVVADRRQLPSIGALIMSTILLRSFLELRSLKSVKCHGDRQSHRKRAGRAVLADRDLSAEMLEQLEGDMAVSCESFTARAVVR